MNSILFRRYSGHKIFNTSRKLVAGAGKEQLTKYLDWDQATNKRNLLVMLSLGHSRTLIIYREDESKKVTLGHGDLLVLEGPQSCWFHKMDPKLGEKDKHGITLLFRQSKC